MAITYATIYGYMLFLEVKRPELNAVIPTIGFNLSTWSLPYLKRLWIWWKDFLYRRSLRRQHENISTNNGGGQTGWNGCLSCDDLCVEVTDDS
jgi:hypothetical protein